MDSSFEERSTLTSSRTRTPPPYVSSHTDRQISPPVLIRKQPHVQPYVLDEFSHDDFISYPDVPETESPFPLNPPETSEHDIEEPDYTPHEPHPENPVWASFLTLPTNLSFFNLHSLLYNMYTGVQYSIAIFYLPVYMLLYSYSFTVLSYFFSLNALPGTAMQFVVDHFMSVSPADEEYSYKSFMRSSVNALMSGMLTTMATIGFSMQIILGITNPLFYCLPVIIIGSCAKATKNHIENGIHYLQDAQTSKEYVWSPTYALMSKVGFQTSPENSVSISFVESVISTIYCLTKTTSIMAATLLVSQFIKSCNHLTFVVCEVMQTKLVELVTPVAMSSHVEDMFKKLAAILITVPLLAGKDIKNAVKIINSCLKASTQNESLVDTVVTTLKWVKNKGGNLLYGIPLDEFYFKEWYKEGSDLHITLTPLNVYLQNNAFRFDTCIKLRDDVKRLIDDGVKFDVFEDTTTSAILFKECVRNLHVLYKQLSAEIRLCQIRRFPVGVTIWGKSGVGKTWTTQRVADLYAGMFDKPGTHESRFNYPSASEYLTNYRDQWCMVLEDINATNEKVIVDGKATTLLDLFSNNALDSNQAAVEDKGAYPIVAELIIASSNSRHMNLGKIYNFVYAALRRFEYSIEQILDDDYAFDGTIDSSKVRGNESKAFKFRVWKPVPIDHQLQPDTQYDGNSQHFVGIFSPQGKRIWSLKEMFVYLGEEFQKHHDSQTRVVQSLSESPFCVECNNIVEVCSSPDKHTHVNRAINVAKTSPIDVKENTEIMIESTYAKSARLLSEHVPMAIAVSTVGIVGAKYAYDYLKSIDPEEEEPVAADHRDMYEPALDLIYNKIHTSTPNSRIKSISHDHSYVLFAWKSCNGSVTQSGWVNCVHLFGNVFWTVSHILDNADYLSIMPHNAILHGSDLWDSSTYRTPLDRLEYNVDKNIDQCLIAFTDMVPPKSKGIYKHLCTINRETDHRLSGTLNVYNSMTDSIDAHEISGKAKYEDSTYRGESNVYHVRCGRFPLASEALPGNCGSLIWATNPDGAGQAIVGIVCAGFQIFNNCYFTMNNQHDIMKMAEGLTPVAMYKSRSSPYYVTKKSKILPDYKDSIWGHVKGHHNVLFTHNSGITPKSKCKPAYFHSVMTSKGLKTNTWERPNFGMHYDINGLRDYPKTPLNRAVTKMKGVKGALSGPSYDRALEYLANQFRTIALTCDCSLMTLSEAINATKWGPSLNMSTSSGFPHFEPKSNFITWDFELQLFIASDRLKHAVEEIMSLWAEGYRVRPTRVATAKDAVVTELENSIGKVRIFYNSELPFLIAEKMLYGKFTHHYKRKRGDPNFNHMYGTNHATDWGALAEQLVEEDPYVAAGDFKSFQEVHSASDTIDKLHSYASIMLETGNISSEEYTMYISHSYDSTYAAVSVKGDVAEAIVGNISGGYLTTLLNIFHNIVLHFYVYDKLGFKDFHLHVKLFTYGDDSIMSTDKKGFNMKAISRVLAEVNVTYTDAHKSESVPERVLLCDAEFLGRNFDIVYGYWNAQLRVDSIVKSLCWRSPATALDDITHAACTLESARFELARYYNSDNETAQKLISLYPIFANMLREHGMGVPDFPTDSECFEYIKTGTMPDSELRFTFDDDVSMRAYVESRFITALSGVGEPGTISEVQEVDTEGVTTFVDLGAEITEEPVPVLNLDPYPVPDSMGLPNVLYRPVLVKTHSSQPPGGTFQWQLNLWPNLLNDPVISPYVLPFENVRATICVRIMTNGSPFHYGGGLIKHLPRSDWQSLISPLDLLQKSQLPGPIFSFDLNSNPVIEFDIPFVSPVNYINIRDCQAGTDTVTPRAHLLCDSYATTETANQTNELATMLVYAWFKPGTLELVVPTALMAKGNPGKDKKSKKKRKKKPGKQTLIEGVTEVSNHIYNYVADQELSEDGPISSITSAAASMAGYLTDVPFIGDYASLAETGLNFATKGFSFFGYSRPTLQTNVIKVSRRPLANLSHMYDADDCEPIAADPQVGIAAEPSNFSPAQTDQMAVMNLARRWTFCSVFDWSTANSVGTRICDIGVTPSFAQVTGGSHDAFRMTTLSHVSYLSQYWGGSIELMIKVYHAQSQRGRLVIQYDPFGTDFLTLPSNQVMNVLIDLESSAEGSTTAIINIPWSSRKEYLDVFKTQTNSFMSATGIIFNEAFMNGALRIGVGSELVGPGGTAVCQVAVFVRGGPDFQLALPTSDGIDTVTALMATGSPGFDILNDKACPYSQSSGFQNPVDVIYLGAPPRMGATMSDPAIYFGEKIVSTRAMLKRFTIWNRYRGIPAVTGEASLHLPARPFPPLNWEGTTDLAVDLDAHQWGHTQSWLSANSPMAWMSPCYYQMYGGLRWKAVIDASATQEGTYVEARRGDPDSMYLPAAVILTTQALGNGAGSGVRLPTGAYIYNGFDGIAATTLDTNNTLNFAIPFFSNHKFVNPGPLNYQPNTNVYRDGLENMGSTITLAVEVNTRINVTLYVAASEDFSLNHFLCTPIYVVNQPW